MLLVQVCVHARAYMLEWYGRKNQVVVAHAGMDFVWTVWFSGIRLGLTGEEL